jgi:hypothetical protein
MLLDTAIVISKPNFTASTNEAWQTMSEREKIELYGDIGKCLGNPPFLLLWLGFIHWHFRYCSDSSSVRPRQRRSPWRKLALRGLSDAHLFVS